MRADRREKSSFDDRGRRATILYGLVRVGKSRTSCVRVPVRG